MISKITLSINGMHCGSCAYLIEDILKEQKGVREAKVDFVKQKGGTLFFGQSSELKIYQRHQLSIFVDQTLDTAQLAVPVQCFEILPDIFVISQLTPLST